MIQVVEWKDLIDVRKKNRSYTCIAETCVLHSDCELKHDSSTTISQNHMKYAEKLVNIALNIFCLCGLFSVEFLFTTYHKAWFNA